MSRIIILGLLIFQAIPDFSQPFSTEKLTVFFEKDIDTLSLAEKVKLDKFIRSYSQHYLASINVAGHTDGDGSQQYNDNLSARRTQSIKRLLQEYALHTEIFTSHFFGEKKLLVQEIDETQKSQNRRVEIILRCSKVENIQDIVSGIQADFDQYFYYDSKIKDIHVKGKKGTMLTMNRDDMLYADGSSLGESDRIEVRLNEIQSFIDQLQANISTQSADGQILESGGMFNVSIRSNQRDLKLKNGATYNAKLPNKYRTDNMQVFNGVKENDGTIRWAVTEQKFSTQTPNTMPRPSVCLDPDKLKNWNIQPRLSQFLIQRDFDFEKPDVLPIPSAPRKAGKLKLITDREYFTWWERLTMSKKKRKEVLSQIHERKITAYNKRVEKIAANNLIFEEKLLEYQSKEDENKAELAAYYDSIEAMYQYLNNYRIASIELEYIKALKNRLKYMIKLSQKDSLFLYNLNDFLFADLTNMADFVPDKYYIKIRDKFEKILMELYNTKDKQQAYSIYLGERPRLDNNILYKTIGEWKAATNDPVVSYIKSKNLELYDREIRAGYRSRVDNIDFFYASLDNFSWINCDKFLKTPPNMMAEYIINDPARDSSIHMVKTIFTMPKINSCINVVQKFSIPQNLDGYVVSYYLNKTKHIMFAKSPVNKDSKRQLDLKYKPVSYSEFSKELASL